MKPSRIRLHIVLCAALACWACGSSARAASITWSAPVTITSTNDVSTNGTLLSAYSFYNGGTTINGVTFANGGTSTTLGTYFTVGPIAGTAFNGFGGGASTPFATLPAEYRTLISNGRYYNSGNSTFTITLNSLTIGHQYQVQFWNNDSRGSQSYSTSYNTVTGGGGNSVQVYLNSTGAQGGVGQSTVGTFVADSSTQTFTVSGVGYRYNDTYITAIQLRDQGLASFSTAGWWNGLNGSAWDPSTTANWSTNASAAPVADDVFNSAMALSGGVAYFPDIYFSNSVVCPVTQSNVTVAAGGVSTTTVNFTANTVNYNLSSADAMGITGATAVNKTGSAVLTLSGGNTYSGATTISAGALRVAHANALSNSLVTVSVANGLQFASGTTTAVLGGLLGSSVALTNQAGAAVTLEVGNNGSGGTYASVFSGPGSLTKVGNGTLSLSVGQTLTGQVTVNGGTLKAEFNNNPNGTLPAVSGITINNGGTLVSGNNGLFGWNANYVPITINAGGTLTTDNGMEPNIYGQITLAGGTLASANPNLTYGSYDFGGGASLILATGSTISTLSAVDFQFRAATTVQVDSGSVLDVTGYFSPLSHSGAMTLTKTGAGILRLAGVNTHGSTVVSNGILQVDGSLPASALTVTTNGTLTGSGTINGPTTIQAGGTLTLGPTNATPGTLNIASTLTLAGNVILKISKTGGSLVSDAINGLTGVTYGGTLTVTNITSDTNVLAVGDTFTLFTSTPGTYGGAFTSSVLPPLPPGLSWDKSQLTTGGQIAVVNTVGTPTFIPAAGGYAGALSVTISSDPGARIFYTTDGSTPTTSSLSGLSPVTGVMVPVNTSSMTITAFATNSGAANSPVASAIYSTVATPTWTSPYSGSWSSAANWSNNVIASGTSATADFSTLTLSGDVYVTLDGARTIGQMVFGDVGNAANWEIDTGSAGPLTLDAGTNSPIVTVNNMTTTLAVPLAGAAGLTKNGNGTLNLTTNETYTGNTIVNAGSLYLSGGGTTYSQSTLQGVLTVNSGAMAWLNSANALGGGGGPGGGGLTDVYLNGGTLAGPHSCIAVGVSYHLSGGTITNTGSLWLGAYTGTPDETIKSTSNTVTSVVAPGGGLYFQTLFAQTNFIITAERGATTNGVDLQIDTGISQSSSSSVVKAGAGTLALNGANTYSGTTTVSNGTLLVNGSLGAGAVTVATNAILGGSGTIGGTATVNPGAYLAPGTPSAIGTLTCSGGVSLTGTALMALNRTNAQTASLVAGAVTLQAGAALVLTNEGPALEGGDTFSLFSAAPGGTFASVALPTPAAGQNWWTTNNYATVSLNQINAGTANFSRSKGLSLKMLIADLMANVSSLPVGTDSFNFAGVSGGGAGSVIITNDTWVFYSSTGDSDDAFSYHVTDARGGSATGTVNIHVTTPASNVGTNSITISGGNAIVSVYGIPGVAYVLQTATNLNGAWWPLTTNTCSASGCLAFPAQPMTYDQQYYRITVP